jgi:hypothetical protein
MTSTALPARPQAARRSKPLTVWGVVVTVTLTSALGRLAASVGTAATTGSPWAFDPTAELVAAALVGASLTWLAPRVTGTLVRRATTLSALLFASVAAVMIEGSAFAPSLSPLDRLPIGLALQLGVSLVTASVAVVLRTCATPAVPGPPRGLPSSVIRVAAGAAVYVVAYMATGAINYALVTGPYYATHAGGVTTPTLTVVLAVAVVEGLLLTVGAIPLARALTGSRWRRALACGLALWVLGGLVPLLQASSLPDVLRAASAVEIALQKVPLGVAVAWLFAAGPIAGRSTALRGPREGGRS